MIPGCSPTKVVQMVLIGCISRSWDQKVGFQNAIFKNLLFWSYKAQSFHIWYIVSSRGPLPKLFKLCFWAQNWSCPGGHNFTLIYIRKTSNVFLSWTANGNLTKHNRNGPWVVPYQIVQVVLIDCISRSQGKKNTFSKGNFQKSFSLKQQRPEHSYLVYNII